MIVVLAALFRFVVNLHFIAIIHVHPCLARLNLYSSIYDRVVIVVSHLEHNPELTLPDYAAGPIQQAHTAVALNQPILDAHRALTDVIPAGQVLSIEELLPRLSRMSALRQAAYNQCSGDYH